LHLLLTVTKSFWTLQMMMYVFIFIDEVIFSYISVFFFFHNSCFFCLFYAASRWWLEGRVLVLNCVPCQQQGSSTWSASGNSMPFSTFCVVYPRRRAYYDA
jgi:hypothetical protein